MITAGQQPNWQKLKWPPAELASYGFYAVDTEGEAHGTSTLFFRVSAGAEMCGPCFTPDAESVFLAVQHPSTGGTNEFSGFERVFTFEDPATRWPDFKDDMPPRPSVVAAPKKGSGHMGDWLPTLMARTQEPHVRNRTADRCE